MLDSDPYPPLLGFPIGARLVQLRDGKKEPAARHGHLSAVPFADFLRCGRNVGIALDAQWLLVDIDRPDTLEAKRLEKRLDEGAPTWKQRSRRGRHWLFKTPANYRGTNVKLRDSAGIPYADIKTLGYVVGPGSEVAGFEYIREGGTEPAEVPGWLWPVYEAAKTWHGDLPVSGREAIPEGERHNFLVRAAGWLRGQHGLSAERIEAGLLGLVEHGVLAEPFNPKEVQARIHAIAKDAARWAPAETDPGLLEPAGWLAGQEAHSGRAERVAWVLRGYVPRAALTVLYGDGGVGKTTMLGWLAARETAKGGRVGFVLVEDNPDRFIAQVAGMAGNAHLLCRPADPLELKLPESAPTIESAIRDAGLTMLVFDSILGHFSYRENENMAERTRAALMPLADIAQRTGCAIVGNLHENKNGQFLGSVEVRNVPRVMLHATRRNTAAPLKVSIAKTNYADPGKRLVFDRTGVPYVNPFSGEAAEEEAEDGSFVPAEVGALIQGESEDASTDDVPDNVNIDELAESIADKVQRHLLAHPGASNAEMVAMFNCSTKAVSAAASIVRKMMQR